MRLVIICCCFFFACSSSEVPSGILPPEKMKVVLFDVIRADEFVNNFRSNDTVVNIAEERSLLYQKVFKLHKISKDAFYKSYSYYQENPEKHKQLFDSLMTYGKAVRDKPVVKPVNKKAEKLIPTEK